MYLALLFIFISITPCATCRETARIPPREARRHRTGEQTCTKHVVLADKAAHLQYDVASIGEVLCKNPMSGC